MEDLGFAVDDLTEAMNRQNKILIEIGRSVIAALTSDDEIACMRFDNAVRQIEEKTPASGLEPERETEPATDDEMVTLPAEMPF